ncbi:MAG TPA: hypothetical protein VEY07_04050 [Thermoplasmata archaeon]|nr:hypothetical protein [Thermoplasmata archaeon]
MAGSSLRPVLDEPALLLTPRAASRPRRIVLADVHLGLGESGPREGLPSRTTAAELARHLVGICAAHSVRHLVIAGDVKHPIVGTPRLLRPVVFDFFAALLEAGVSVDVVLGNHDVGLAPHVPREVRVHGAEGFVIDGVGIFHGHRWPSPAVLAAPALVVGHLHPGVRLAPSAERPTGKERCWVRVDLRRPVDPARPEARAVRGRELVVLPAFNPLAGTEALNRERPRRGRSFLYRRFLLRGEARAYLLDGTDVGKLTTPASEPRSEGAPGSSTRRPRARDISSRNR